MAVVDHGSGKDGGGQVGGGDLHLYLFFSVRKRERAVKSQLHVIAFGRLIYYCLCRVICHCRPVEHTVKAQLANTNPTRVQNEM